MILALILIVTAGVSEAQTKAELRVEEAQAVLKQVMSGADQGIPQYLMDDANCVGIFPGVMKFSLLFGGQYGKGLISCRTNERQWSAPSTFRIEGASAGFQVGANTTDLVLLFMAPDSINKLLRTNFTLGLDATAAGGPVGRSAHAKTDALFGAQILSYSRAQGIFAGAALDGATLRPAHGADRRLYGYEPLTRDVLRGDIPPPDSTKELLQLLREYSPHKQDFTIEMVEPGS